MIKIGLLFVALFPILFLAYYVYKKDKIKEPEGLLLKVFIVGGLSIFPALLIELMLDNFLPSQDLRNIKQIIYSNFIGVALVEEICKWTVVMVFAYKNKYFDEVYDGIVYAVFTALGFACLENLIYVYSYGLSTGLVRSILSVPSHACDGILMGFYIAHAKRAGIKKHIKIKIVFLILSLLVPTLIHGAYDYLLCLGKDISILLFFIILILVYLISYKIVDIQSNKNEKLTS